MNGQLQPVKTLDPNKNIYFTSCSGAVEDWGSCNIKAKDTCSNSYEVLKDLKVQLVGEENLLFNVKNRIKF
jgi:hypothetical protein